MLKTLRVPVLLLFLCLLLYSATFHSPFTFDDSPFILNDKPIHIQELKVDAFVEAAVNGQPPYRPLSSISFAVNYFFGKENPAGYHLVNLLIHFLAGLFLYFLILYSLELSEAAENNKDSALPTAASMENNFRWLAFAGVCMWLAHPLHTQSVTYICQRMTSMAAMFYAASMVFYIRGRMAALSIRPSSIRPFLWFFSALVAGICAVAGKPNAATLPLMIVAYDWFFFRNHGKISAKNRAIWVIGALIVLAALSILYLGHDPVARILSGYQSREFTLSQRVMTQFRVVIYYISLIFFPHPDRLNLDYDYPLSYSLSAPWSTGVSAAALAACIFMVVFSARRDRLLSFCIFWFLSNLVIESSVIGLEMVFEHRLYLPSMFIVPVIAVKWFQFIRVKSFRIGFGCILIALLGLWTYERNQVWADEVRLWEDCVRKSPEKARPHYNLGCLLIKRDLYDQAISQFEKAVRIYPGFVDAYYNLGVATAQNKDYKKAAGYFQKTLSRDPANADAHNNLANALSKISRSEDAITHYQEAVRLQPEKADFLVNLAMEYFSAGNFEQAILHYQKAQALLPDDPSILNKLGYAYFSAGNTDEAISCYVKALRRQPDNPESLGKMGDALLQKGNPKPAVYYYLKALALNPGDAQTNYNLGIAYFQTGNRAQAAICFNQAYRLNPDLRPPSFIGTGAGQPSLP